MVYKKLDTMEFPFQKVKDALQCFNRPIYETVILTLNEMIETGMLPPGTKFPPDKKLAIENELKAWINQNPERKSKYGEMFDLYKEGYQETTDGDVYPTMWTTQGALIGSKILMNSFQVCMGLSRIYGNDELTKEERE